MGRMTPAGAPAMFAATACVPPPRLSIRNDTVRTSRPTSLSVTDAGITVDDSPRGWRELSAVRKDGVGAAKPVRKGRVHSHRFGYTRKAVRWSSAGAAATDFSSKRTMCG